MLLKVGWIVALVAMLSATGFVYVQGRIKTDRENRERQKVYAKVLFASESWQESADTYAKIVQEEPENAGAWFMLALSHHYTGEFSLARREFVRAGELGHSIALVHYNIACTYNKQGQTDSALEQLELAVREGEFSAAMTLSDPDLRSLHKNERFQKIVSLMRED